MDLMRILEGFKEDPFKETKRILERFLRILSMIFVRILKAIIIIMILQGSLDKLVMRILSVVRENFANHGLVINQNIE